jgi:hypothetical protein
MWRVCCRTNGLAELVLERCVKVDLSVFIAKTRKVPLLVYRDGDSFAGWPVDHDLAWGCRAGKVCPGLHRPPPAP